jgi:hypothetical protein
MDIRYFLWVLIISTKKNISGILNHCNYPIHTGKLEGVTNKIYVIKGYRLWALNFTLLYVENLPSFLTRVGKKL